MSILLANAQTRLMTIDEVDCIATQNPTIHSNISSDITPSLNLPWSCICIILFRINLRIIFTYT